MKITTETNPDSTHSPENADRPVVEQGGTLQAARDMDWQQVVGNGGPPCFHLDDTGRFCGRAKRWVGHNQIERKVIDHDFVSLENLLATSQRLVEALTKDRDELRAEIGTERNISDALASVLLEKESADRAMDSYIANLDDPEETRAEWESIKANQAKALTP